MSQSRYLNIYVHGDKKKLPHLLTAISKSLRDGWQVADDGRRRTGDEVQEYRFTANSTTGFLRFFCSADRPYVFYLRDSGLIGSESPITLQDNDYLVRHFVSSILKPICTDLDFKLQVTRSMMH
ncbi:hypothetical protein KF707_18105 [Candidatus Obscuribacterales bacterium]|jgi:hypothetical protein|nr:hypothetical protein [Candidatus Obscuribacterales bacterium]MBX3138147.1 hypothetical protein [Candidatus Obscuribacterales bacterium]MBX3151135.1 hypothetical protein [Candidatus Obscuribacterales bacterium]